MSCPRFLSRSVWLPWRLPKWAFPASSQSKVESRRSEGSLASELLGDRKNGGEYPEIAVRQGFKQSVINQQNQDLIGISWDETAKKALCDLSGTSHFGLMSFLRAEWRKLALANYAVDPALLQPMVPHKTELDLWNDTCYVSLVGFMFVNTRLLGIKVPFM